MTDDIQLDGILEDFARSQNADFREEIQQIQKQKQREIHAAKRHLTGVIDALRVAVGAPDDYEFYCDDDGVGFQAPDTEGDE